MTDERRTPDPEAALAALAPGTLVIFRHYGAPDRAALGRRLRALARRRRLPFLVAGDRRLARKLKADGLHLPGAMAARLRHFAPAGDRWPVSAAAHGPRSARRAARNGAGLVLLSPVFATASHPGRRPLGLLALAGLARTLSVPVLALGGVSLAEARRVLRTGAAGMAGIGGLARLSRDPFGLRR